MNKRIRELMIQSNPHGDFKDCEWVFEKFAELIVMECIDCARGAGLANDVAVRNGLGFNDGISEAVTHMKKHFGVEK